jgi:hypothetical protein
MFCILGDYDHVLKCTHAQTFFTCVNDWMWMVSLHPHSEVANVCLPNLPQGAMNNKMPKVSYMKAIDWYVIACFLAMVLSFVESMVVFRAVVHNEKQDTKDEEDWGAPLKRRNDISVRKQKH